MGLLSMVYLVLNLYRMAPLVILLTAVKQLEPTGVQVLQTYSLSSGSDVIVTWHRSRCLLKLVVENMEVVLQPENY